MGSPIRNMPAPPPPMPRYRSTFARRYEAAEKTSASPSPDSKDDGMGIAGTALAAYAIYSAYDAMSSDSTSSDSFSTDSSASFSSSSGE